MLPTPAVNDMGAGKTVEQWDAWTDDLKARHGNGNGHGKSLSIEAQRMLPTPRSSDGPKGGPNQTGDGLQPAMRMLLTPNAADGEGGGRANPPPRGEGGKEGSGGLREQVRTLPTPCSTDANGARNATSGRTNPDSGHHSGWTLNDVRHADRWGEYGPAIARWEHLLGRPAPDPTDDKGRLSPAFVEWMMGWPEGWVDLDGLSRANRLKILGNGVVPQQAAAAFGQLLARVTADQTAAA